MSKRYVLTDVLARKLGVFRWSCAACMKPFAVGDVVVSRRRNRRGGQKRYHVECWESKFVEVTADE